MRGMPSSDVVRMRAPSGGGITIGQLSACDRVYAENSAEPERAVEPTEPRSACHREFPAYQREAEPPATSGPSRNRQATKGRRARAHARRRAIGSRRSGAGGGITIGQLSACDRVYAENSAERAVEPTEPRSAC